MVKTIKARPLRKAKVRTLPKAEVFMNPFEPKPTRTLRLKVGDKIAAVVGSLCFNRNQDEVYLNGKRILAKVPNRRFRRGDALAVYRRPGKKVVGSVFGKALLAIAVVAAAVVAAPVVAASLGFAEAAFATAFITGTLASGGLMLLNAILPPPSQKAIGGQGGGEVEQSYQLFSQGNRADKLGMIPVAFGKSRTYPKLAAPVFSTADGSDQYLRALYMPSVSPDEAGIKITATQIGDDSLDQVYEGDPVLVVADGVAKYGTASDKVEFWQTAKWTGGEVAGYEKAVDVVSVGTQFDFTQRSGNSAVSLIEGYLPNVKFGKQGKVVGGE